MKIRNYLFDAKILHETQFHVPVISVGNLNVGGTGKTPHVEYLANILADSYRVAILSRGYGRKSKGFRIVYKNDSAVMTGDEPLQYANVLLSSVVAVCEKRVMGIERLLELHNREVIILDDAFQHRYVKPGLNILLTAFNDLYVNDTVLPAGRLREPVSGAKRADIIIVTKCSSAISPKEKEGVINQLKLLNHQKIYFSYMHYRESLELLNGGSLDLDELRNKKVLLVTGIADPTMLRNFISCLAIETEAVIFPDHHLFTVGDLSGLRKKFDRFARGNVQELVIITTRKDAMRLRSPELKMIIKDLPLAVIDIEIRISSEEDNFKKNILRHVESY